MKKEEIIEVFKKWYMPNFYDKTMFDYTTLSNEEIYELYLEELDNFGEEINEELEKHL